MPLQPVSVARVLVVNAGYPGQVVLIHTRRSNCLVNIALAGCLCAGACEQHPS